MKGIAQAACGFVSVAAQTGVRGGDLARGGPRLGPPGRFTDCGVWRCERPAGVREDEDAALLGYGILELKRPEERFAALCVLVRNSTAWLLSVEPVSR